MAQIKKGKVNGKLMDILTPDEYYAKMDIYDPNYTAIEYEGILYPIKNNKTFDQPGYYDEGPIEFYIKPDEKDISNYSAKNIIDFSDIKDMKEMMEKTKTLKNIEKDILTGSDNIYAPVIGENDSPEMVALKTAIIEKHIDIDAYAPRFNIYNNDKRLLKKSDITLVKLRTMMNALDIKGTLILEDKSPDVPNPIGRVISVDLNKGEDEDE